MRRDRVALLAAAVLLFITPVIAAPGSAVIQSVAVSRTTFDPSSGESIRIDIALKEAGTVDVMVVDRDGYPVRSLAAARPAAAGTLQLEWNGRDDRGDVIPDEAYSFRVLWSDGRRSASYFPALDPAEMKALQARYYSRGSGTLVYDLPAACRVHVQAGTFAVNPRTKRSEGPVLKTIVNREPRAAGRIAEHWNGLDESGRIFVPDEAGFVTAIAATPLPENSVIAIGNHAKTFIQYALQRSGAPLFTHAGARHQHHAGLSALDDVSPPMKLEPLNAVWSAADHVWLVADPTLRVRVVIDGPTASRFVAQPAKLHEFANGRLLRAAPPKQSAPIIEIDTRQLKAAVNTISVNWQSLYGAVAANSLSVRVAPAASRTAAGAER